MVMLWYMTGRVGWQGVPPEGSDITMEIIAYTFENSWEESEQGARAGGDHAYTAMRRSQRCQEGQQEERKRMRRIEETADPPQN